MTQMKRSFARHYSYQTIVRLCQTLPELWIEAGREAHREDGNALVRAHFEFIRHTPLFELCRQVRDEDDEPLNAAHDASGRLWRFFGGRENVAVLPSAYCVTATELARAIEATRQAAKLEQDTETRKLLDIGFYTLKRQLSRLLSVGLLAELPVAPTMPAPPDTMLQKVAGVLLERRQVFKRASTDTRFESWIRADLAETMGSRIFDSVRAQERHRAEICIEGLARHLGRPQPRFRRAIFADAALGLQETFEVAVQHASAIKRAKPGSIERQRRKNASLISWITVVEVLRSGFLLNINGQLAEVN